MKFEIIFQVTIYVLLYAGMLGGMLSALNIPIAMVSYTYIYHFISLKVLFQIFSVLEQHMMMLWIERQEGIMEKNIKMI